MQVTKSLRLLRRAWRAISSYPRQAVIQSSSPKPSSLASAALCMSTCSGALYFEVYSVAFSEEGKALNIQQIHQSNNETAQWRVFTDVARDLVREKNYAAAEKYLRRALDAARQGFGQRDPHVASACQNLAELYRLQKRFEDAAPLYDEALSILNEAYGTRDIRLAFALHNVAGHYYAQGKLEKAASYYEQALHVKLATVGPGHTETANTLFHLSEVRWAQGRRREAIELARKSLDALAHQGIDEGMRRQYRLAEMLLDTGRPAEAEPLLRNAVEKEKDGSVKRAIAEENLARALCDIGELEQAKTSLQNAFDIRKHRFSESFKDGKDEVGLAACLRRIAEVELRLATATGSRPVNAAQAHMNALHAAFDAVKSAEKAHELALDGEQILQATIQSGDSGVRGTTATADNDSVWHRVQKLWRVNSVDPRVAALKVVRPETTTLELSACLRTLAEVHLAVGDLKEAQNAAQRALLLVTQDRTLNGRSQIARNGGRLADLRKRSVCQSLMVNWRIAQGLHGEESREAAALAESVAAHGCAFDLVGKVCSEENTKKGNWWPFSRRSE